MADFLLVILTVIAVGLGAFHLGRMSMKDRLDYMREELEAESALSNELMGMHRKGAAPNLRVVRGEE